MTAGASLQISGDCMQLAGVVDFATVVALQREGDAWLRGGAPTRCRLDMSGVTRSNSAGTALLLAWLRTVATAGKRLTVENPPQTLVSLMELAGLGQTLVDVTPPQTPEVQSSSPAGLSAAAQESELMSETKRAGDRPIPVDVTAGETYFWCACGRSATQPFCDGSHQGTGMSPRRYDAAEDGKIFFCACKATGSPPLCDGSHKG